MGRAGQIKWRGEYVFVSEAVRGELVGLAEMDTGGLARAVHARGARPHRSTDAPVYAGVAWPVPRMSAARRCGNAAAMEITERFPQLLGNLTQNVRFPHSHSGSPRCPCSGRGTTIINLNQVLPMYPV